MKPGDPVLTQNPGRDSKDNISGKKLELEKKGAKARATKQMGKPQMGKGMTGGQNAANNNTASGKASKQRG